MNASTLTYTHNCELYPAPPSLLSRVLSIRCRLTERDSRSIVHTGNRPQDEDIAQRESITGLLHTKHFNIMLLSATILQLNVHLITVF